MLERVHAQCNAAAVGGRLRTAHIVHRSSAQMTHRQHGGGRLTNNERVEVNHGKVAGMWRSGSGL